MEWMERHNRERDERQLLTAEMDELKGVVVEMKKRTASDKEEIQQLTKLFDAETSQSKLLEEALRYLVCGYATYTNTSALTYLPTYPPSSYIITFLLA